MPQQKDVFRYLSIMHREILQGKTRVYSYQAAWNQIRKRKVIVTSNLNKQHWLCIAAWNGCDSNWSIAFQKMRERGNLWRRNTFSIAQSANPSLPVCQRRVEQDGSLSSCHNLRIENVFEVDAKDPKPVV